MSEVPLYIIGTQSRRALRQLGLTHPFRCRANMAQIRQSRPDYGLGFLEKAIETSYTVSCSLFTRQRTSYLRRQLKHTYHSHKQMRETFINSNTAPPIARIDIPLFTTRGSPLHGSPILQPHTQHTRTSSPLQGYLAHKKMPPPRTLQ